MTSFERRMVVRRKEHDAALAAKALWARPLDSPLGHPLNPLPYGGNLAADMAYYKVHGRKQRPTKEENNND